MKWEEAEDEGQLFVNVVGRKWHYWQVESWCGRSAWGTPNSEWGVGSWGDWGGSKNSAGLLIFFNLTKTITFFKKPSVSLWLVVVAQHWCWESGFCSDIEAVQQMEQRLCAKWKENHMSLVTRRIGSQSVHTRETTGSTNLWRPYWLDNGITAWTVPVKELQKYPGCEVNCCLMWHLQRASYDVEILKFTPLWRYHCNVLSLSGSK